MSDKQQVWSAGPTLTGLRPVFAKIREFLRGRLPVQDGVAIESGKRIAFRGFLVGDTIRIEFDSPQPVADVTYLMRFKKPIVGANITDEKITIEIAGLPDPTFEVLS